ncbi:MAG: DUF3467 domain-containing protein [Actinobacteria bacterium]|nr:DUF3467 domain-containing protein [Actinomycetota bacterium]
MAGPAGSGGPGGPRGEGQQAKEIKVNLPQNIVGGVYANAMLVQHTDDEFVMDFTLLVGGNGTVVSRVITSPGHMKRMIAALQENLRRYEGSHGVVKGREVQPRMRLGFQPPAE